MPSVTIIGTVRFAQCCVRQTSLVAFIEWYDRS